MLGNLYYAFVIFNQVICQFMLTHFSVLQFYVVGAVSSVGALRFQVPPMLYVQFQLCDGSAYLGTQCEKSYL